MKYVDEYRDISKVKAVSHKIHEITTKAWNIMEICGGQTHSIMKYNLKEFLPRSIELIHGPGCPVCVTPLEKIDKALHIAALPDVIFTSFGDMLRVPGSDKDLLQLKAEGADVRMVFSPLDAVDMAQKNPDKKVVFFAIGFETTAPVNALSVIKAKQLDIQNFSILSSHVLVPPAIEAILSDPYAQVHAFLAAGHVCSVMGFNEYIPISEKYKTPIAVTGFEPVDILAGIYSVIRMLESGTYRVKNAYKRVVKQQGNTKAQASVHEIFEKTDFAWRGIGVIPKSGLKVREAYAQFDAEKIFNVSDIRSEESAECISGEILRGIKKPKECAAFGTLCTPEKPLGAPMVSHEGACAAYYRYAK